MRTIPHSCRSNRDFLHACCVAALSSRTLVLPAAPPMPIDFLRTHVREYVGEKRVRRSGGKKGRTGDGAGSWHKRGGHTPVCIVVMSPMTLR